MSEEKVKVGDRVKSQGGCIGKAIRISGDGEILYIKREDGKASAHDGTWSCSASAATILGPKGSEFKVGAAVRMKTGTCHYTIQSIEGSHATIRAVGSGSSYEKRLTSLELLNPTRIKVESEKMEKGDYVRFVSTDNVDDEYEGIYGRKYWQQDELKLGESYKVLDHTESVKGTAWIILEGTYSSMWHRVEHFEIAVKNSNNTTKQEEQIMSINSSIRKIFVEEEKASFEQVEELQAAFGSQISEDFTGEINLRENKDLYVKELDRCKKEAVKKAKKAKEAAKS